MLTFCLCAPSRWGHNPLVASARSVFVGALRLGPQRRGFARLSRASPRPPPIAATLGRRHHFSVAVIGSGPAAFYVTKYLFRQADNKPAAREQLRVDMFERLFVPFGLVRFGVAPDHPEVKNVVNDFDAVADNLGFRFFGGVAVGEGNVVSLDLLRRAYDAVVVCTGAEGEKRLGIAGEQLEGNYGSAEFVKWYNGHPDFACLDPVCPGSAVAVVGHGNVALDIARVLLRSPDSLRASDVAPAALDRIAAWQAAGLREVHVIGRRGFAQAAFTTAELRELLRLDGVVAVVDPLELRLGQTAASAAEVAGSRAKQRQHKVLSEMARHFAAESGQEKAGPHLGSASLSSSTKHNVLRLRCLAAPAEVLGDAATGRVAGLRIQRTRLVGEAGRQSAVSTGDKAEDLACGMVIRSVGFAPSPLAGLPPMKASPQAGREEAPDRGPGGRGGLYVAGWAAGAPKGTIATTMSGAIHTAALLFADLEAAAASAGASGNSRPGRSAVEAALSTAGVAPIPFSAWRRLEAEERRRGEAEGRSAVKITSPEEMLKIMRSE